MTSLRLRRVEPAPGLRWTRSLIGAKSDTELIFSIGGSFELMSVSSDNAFRNTSIPSSSIQSRSMSHARSFHSSHLAPTFAFGARRVGEVEWSFRDEGFVRLGCDAFWGGRFMREGVESSLSEERVGRVENEEASGRG